MLDFP